MKRLYLTGLLALAAVFLLGALAPAAVMGTKELDNEALVIKFYREVASGGYQVVDTATLKKWLDANKPMIVVDTMPYAASYQKNHIPGAVQFEFPVGPMKGMDQAAQAKYAKLLGADKKALIVVYCGFPKCDRSHNGALWAKKLGYTNVYRYPGGIMAWMEKGLPTASK